jgi:hypothetical protein
MSITGIKKRIACFYDDKGDYLGSCGFSKTEKHFEYENRRFNVFHDNVTYTKFSRWYWDVEIYHYNINNPNPLDLKKKVEPIFDAEMYNIQIKTEVAKKLNDLANPSWLKNLSFGTIALFVIIAIVGYMLITKQIQLG